MNWAPRRGRPVALPHDSTPLRGATVDARARIAWLLRVRRLASGATGTRFADLLRAAGCELSASTLSRYETGAEPVPMSVVRAYEVALEVPAGLLVGAAGGIDRMFGPALAEETTVLPGRAEIRAMLGHWERTIATGGMTGVDWLAVADIVSAPDGPVLPPSVQRAWVRRLVVETTRSTHHELTTRMHAIRVLIRDPFSSDLLVETIDQMSDNAQVDGVHLVIALLGQSQDPAVLRRLVGHFGRSGGARQWGAAYGLLGQISRGTMPADIGHELANVLLDVAASGDPSRGDVAFAVAQRLSADLAHQVVERLGRYPGPTTPGARIDSPATLSRYRAAALRESGVQDRMLDRLLREVLSPEFRERQFHSAQLLCASPYRRVLAEVALRLVTESVEPYAGEAAAYLLSHLADDDQRRRLSRRQPLTPRRRALVSTALGRLGSPAPADATVRPRSHDDGPRRREHRPDCAQKRTGNAEITADRVCTCDYS